MQNWEEQLKNWNWSKGEKMKLYLQSILIVLVAMIISAFLIAGMCFGIKLIIDGWEIVKELKEMCLSCL